MVLVDTSSWIHFLRPDGHATPKSRVQALLQAGTACWCPMVRLELWNGAGGDREKRVLREFERLLPELPITTQVWDEAYELARRCRGRGVTIPATDLLIIACFRHHSTELEQSDNDFDQVLAVLKPN